MRKSQQKPRIDIYTGITEKIVADLEKGVRPWMQPWSSPTQLVASHGRCVSMASPILA